MQLGEWSLPTLLYTLNRTEATENSLGNGWDASQYILIQLIIWRSIILLPCIGIPTKDFDWQENTDSRLKLKVNF